MPHTILYVEDEPAIIDLVRDILRHPEVTLVAAGTVSEGMKLARAERPDLIILDLLMPGRDGWSLYNEVRVDPQLGQTPIIILTAVLHSYRVEKEFATSPIDAYITKPFEAGVLRRQIEQMLGVALWSSRTAR